MIPDPTPQRTFLSAKLNWQEVNEASHADWLLFTAVGWHSVVVKSFPG